jgi:outer membrane protein assembly factor BamD
LKEAEAIKKSSEKAIIDVRKLIAFQNAEMKVQQEKIKAAAESKKEETKNK